MYARQGRGHELLRALHRRHDDHALRRLDRRDLREARSNTIELVLHYQPTSASTTGASPASRRWCAGTTRPRAGRTGRVHPARRGDRPDRAARPLGAARACRQAAALGPVAPTGGQRRRRASSSSTDSSTRSRGPRRDRHAPERLLLEVTEILAGRRHTRPSAAALRRLGVRLAIDDFGTGYSSLALPAPLPDGRPEDRPLVHPRSLPRRRPRRRDRGHGGDARPRPGPRGHRGPPSSPTPCLALGCPLGQGYLFARPSRPRNSPASPCAPPHPSRSATGHGEATGLLSGSASS